MAQPTMDIDQFARNQARELGLDRPTEQWVDPATNPSFKANERAHTTLLIAGLTRAQDVFIAAAMRGLGYNMQVLDAPDNAALQVGKEFGNRGQCNPTYYTVGNLVKYLMHLRDEKGMSTEAIIQTHIFVTAGACGPCRFGMYVTEYRKALRDAGFDGFRVVLFQQQGGLKQATGEEEGLKIDQTFAISLVRAMMVGDVLNLIGYRMRPYEIVEGSTNAALEECKKIIIEAMENRRSSLLALRRCKKILAKVKLDRLRAKPVVSIIGEFWAMTTEGDGNYELQKFLESEGAEVDIQGVTNWILFMVWENKFDRLRRIMLRDEDEGRKGLKGKDAGKTLWMLKLADALVRLHFQTYAHAIGLKRYHLPNLDEIADLASKHYDNNVRGGEGHMEVGKLIHFVEDKVNHMTVSVKPFGCMPSSGVSDGVQSIITAKYPEAIFLPIETTGDGKVNVYSRIQMMLFKARQRAKDEYQAALTDSGATEDQLRTRVASRSNFWRPKHVDAGPAANIVRAMDGRGLGYRMVRLAAAPARMLASLIS
ncbi:MAG: 2-hydroxyglutaryl-CoA dehydratase [Deltaproteobacteria bacterium]|nr:2-hydroxyglutaryl-CoA dehydratase [Deltaproteobacteria bacterium]MCB9478424.1 2-hydroxyglutaryl-CoA dehydratase [Deltaproteobacteria bacterium]